MASGHIASIKSSARQHQKHMDDQHMQESAGPSANLPEASIETSQCESIFSKMSFISINDEDGRSIATSQQAQPMAPEPFVSAPLQRLDNLQDIDNSFDDKLHQVNVLNKLETEWCEIANNLDSTVRHLQECSNQITEASSECLQTLLDSVETTCDKVDNELKAFYHLMTKCEEITTKLSIATSFRDEIKTLRKSVETLEQLYRSSPLQQRNHQANRTSLRP